MKITKNPKNEEYMKTLNFHAKNEMYPVKIANFHEKNAHIILWIFGVKIQIQGVPEEVFRRETFFTVREITILKYLCQKKKSSN